MIIVLMVLLLCVSQNTYAQTNQKSQHEFLPEARFFADLKKHFGPKPYQLVYSWEHNIGMDASIYGYKKHKFHFLLNVQTAGAPPSGRRVNIAGTSYILGFNYSNKFKENTSFSSGIIHLSSHLSEDVLKIVREEAQRGVIIPPVGFDDINVLFVEVAQKFNFIPLEPKVNFRFQPLGVKFHRGFSYYEEPVFIATESKILKSGSSDIVFQTRNELGKEHFGDYSLRFDFFKAQTNEEGRLQWIFGYSPGEGLRASPNTGWHKEGFFWAMRFVFWAH